MQRDELIAGSKRFGPWFHQIDLGQGVLTRSVSPAPGPQSPDHPRPRWLKIRDVLPADMAGMYVLDVGCSDGFFSFEMARRGARVLSVDAARQAVRRLRWAKARLGLRGIRARRGDIYDFDKGITPLDRLRHWLRRRQWQVGYVLKRGRDVEPLDYVPRRFDLVFMFALLYHVREPLAALQKLGPLADVLFIETIAVDDEEHSHLQYQAPMPGVTHEPKWFPTTRCLKDMLHWVGYDEVLEIAGPEDKRPIYLAWKRGADLKGWRLPGQ
jgi:SAM-dependent methyltransferase